MTVSIPSNKSDVLRNYQSRRGQELPALNVKCYAAPEYTAERIRQEFGCSKVAAEKAAENVYECEGEQFWEYDAPELINHVMLGDTSSEYKPAGLKEPLYKVYGAGRSGGWLVVEGLPPVSEWDGATFQKWRKFARLIAETMAHKLTFECARDLIEANEWCPKEDTAAGAARDAELTPVNRLALAALEIHGELNGREWSPDTLNKIADHLRDAGLAIAEPYL